MKASEIRAKYLKFFAGRGHAIIPAASIVPPDDPTTLFTSSGMQQLVPYLKGAKHPMGTRLADSQPSFRADDIEEVGDNRHTTMFEMLGNWSLGDYFKKEQLPWVWEFFTKDLGLDPKRLYVTVFAGDAKVAPDVEAVKIWQEVIGTLEPAKPGPEGWYANTKIYAYASNWWSRAGGPDKMPIGEVGGPDSEIFFDFGSDLKLHENSIFSDETCHVGCDCGRFLEIGNSVFMQFIKTVKGMEPLPAQNVDFGGGFERITAAVQDTPDIFMTDLYSSIVATIELSSGKEYEGEFKPSMRVIADHLRAATFMIAQGITPSNKLQGYILRRLLRRAAVRGRKLGGDIKKIFADSIPAVVEFYAEAGFIGQDAGEHVRNVVAAELDKFGKAMDRGLKEIEHTDAKQIDAQFAFNLYQSLGFPFEITRDLLAEKNITLDQTEFDKIFAKHKEGSRTASVGMFKGGLADQSEITTKYHTGTHLLHQALRDVLGDEVQQAGSNITSERLRFDYTYSGKPTADQLLQIEKIINEKIVADLVVSKIIEDKDKALSSGARAFFAEKYPDKVSVYAIGDYSREICGGPHVEHTGSIGKLQIFKDESLSSGKRRIYAKLV